VPCTISMVCTLLLSGWCRLRHAAGNQCDPMFKRVGVPAVPAGGIKGDRARATYLKEQGGRRPRRSHRCPVSARPKERTRGWGVPRCQGERGRQGLDLEVARAEPHWRRCSGATRQSTRGIASAFRRQKPGHNHLLLHVRICAFRKARLLFTEHPLGLNRKANGYVGFCR
jgi:hypothetical protein